MSITRNLLICVWNILRYSLRIWNGKQKTHDIEKIAHYAELAWIMSDGKVIKNDSWVVKRNAPLSDGEGLHFIYIGRIKYVGDLKKYDFYGIILLSVVKPYLILDPDIKDW